MTRGLIVANGSGGDPELLRRLARESDVVAAVDGGWHHCEAAGVVPDLLLGDMDSIGEVPVRPGMTVERLPCEKDDTDTIYAMRRLAQLHCGGITVCCALGGRLDHLVANLQSLLFLEGLGVKGRIVSPGCCAEAFAPGEHRLRREGYRFFSLFSLGDACEGVTILGAKYPLDGYRLQNDFPIGVSNEFLGPEAVVRFSSGRLLAVRCSERGGAD